MSGGILDNLFEAADISKELDVPPDVAWRIQGERSDARIAAHEKAAAERAEAERVAAETNVIHVEFRART